MKILIIISLLFCLQDSVRMDTTKDYIIISSKVIDGYYYKDGRTDTIYGTIILKQMKLFLFNLIYFLNSEPVEMNFILFDFVLLIGIFAPKYLHKLAEIVKK